jgi:hypothetical protein
MMMPDHTRESRCMPRFSVNCAFSWCDGLLQELDAKA